MKHIVEKDEEYEILIYMPILSEINQFIIESPENYKIKYQKNEKNKTLLIAGGMHSFGIGCTACGVMFSNILGRKFNYNVQNISFNKKNFLKNTYECFKKYEHPKSELTILELDYTLQNDEIFNKYIIKKLMKKYSKNKRIEILDLSFIYDEEYSEMCTYGKNFINDMGNILIYKKLEETIKKIELD